MNKDTPIKGTGTNWPKERSLPPIGSIVQIGGYNYRVMGHQDKRTLLIDRLEKVPIEEIK